VNLCSASGSTHIESGKLYSKVKHRSRPNVSSPQWPKRAPAKRRSHSGHDEKRSTKEFAGSPGFTPEPDHTCSSKTGNQQKKEDGKEEERLEEDEEDSLTTSLLLFKKKGGGGGGGEAAAP